MSNGLLLSSGYAERILSCAGRRSLATEFPSRGARFRSTVAIRLSQCSAYRATRPCSGTMATLPSLLPGAFSRVAPVLLRLRSAVVRALSCTTADPDHVLWKPWPSRCSRVALTTCTILLACLFMLRRNFCALFFFFLHSAGVSTKLRSLATRL